MAEFTVGSLHIPVALLGPVGSCVIKVLDLVMDQLAVWKDNKNVISRLQQFQKQTQEHQRLLVKLAAQLAAKADCEDVGAVIGASL